MTAQASIKRMTAAQSSWSVSGTIGLYGSPSSISASYAKGDAYGNYASVTTTSGLFAGSGGYAVTVGGTTTLTAAALASRADASKNSLATGALVTQNLANSMSWKASSWGFSFSVSNAGMGGVQPGLGQKQSGHSSGLAQATIAPGNISIVNASLQKALTGKSPEQIVAALNRSAAALNKAADRLPGALAQTLQNQADRSSALTAASSSTAKLVGDAASLLKASADQVIAKYAKNPPQSQAQQDELDAAKLQQYLWAEGGPGRALLHGATQGVLAWLGGGFSLDAGLRGAGGAMLASGLGARIADQAQKLLNEAGLDSSDKPGALAGLIGQLVMTGLGSAAGNMGAVTAASVYINNYLTHKEFADFLKKLEQCKAEGADCSQLVREYEELSAANDRALAARCYTQQCVDDALRDMVTLTEMDRLKQLDGNIWLRWYENDTYLVSRSALDRVAINIDFLSGYRDYSYSKCGNISAAQCVQNYTAAYGNYLKDAATAEYAKFALAAVTLGVAVAPEVASYCLANPYSCTATVNAAGDSVLCVSTNVCGSLAPDAGTFAKEAAAALEEKFAAQAAADAASGARLNSQLIAEEVASGHAFEKHVIEGGEFAPLEIRTRQQFQDFIEEIVSNPMVEKRYATDGTVYYLDESTRTIVIRGQRGEATAFRPDYGIGWDNYLNTQVPKNLNPPAYDPASARRF